MESVESPEDEVKLNTPLPAPYIIPSHSLSPPLTHFHWPPRQPDLIPVERREGTKNEKE